MSGCGCRVPTYSGSVRRCRLHEAAPQMLAALVLVESRLSKEPQHNAWDLGPSPVLAALRETIALVKDPTPREDDR